MQIKESSFKIIVKTNSNKNEIIGFDKERKVYRIAIKAKPEKGEANKAIIKFLSKDLKKQVRISKGLKSREKIIKVT